MCNFWTIWDIKKLKLFLTNNITIFWWPLKSFGSTWWYLQLSCALSKKFLIFHYFFNSAHTFQIQSKGTKYFQMTSEVTKKNFRSIGQDLTDCQLLLIFTSVKSDEKRLATSQILTNWPEIFFGDLWGCLGVLGGTYNLVAHCQKIS